MITDVVVFWMLFFWSTFKHFSNLIHFELLKPFEQPLALLGSVSFSLSPLELHRLDLRLKDK